jgi:hypothetical protein
MGNARDDFLRRYATSPMHVPRLERMLQAYESADDDDSFARNFIDWDRACPDAEAARIVSEIISAGTGAARLSDDAVKGAIRWMAEATDHPVAERARILGEAISSPDETTRRHFIEFLETSAALEQAAFQMAARRGPLCAPK